MPYFLLLIPILMLLFLVVFRRPKEGNDPASGQVVTLETVDGADCLVYNGRRYYEVLGEDGCDGTFWWDWHGRMGDGLGVLTRSGALLPTGELYCLREGTGEILLAHLPEEGWPLTDMKIFVAEGTVLPTLTADGFSYGEVYRIEGDLGEEEWTRVCEITEPSHLRCLAEAWLSEEEVSLPEGEYVRYRVRLHWGKEPGLYATFNVNVSENGLSAVEKYRFRGDAPLPTEVKEYFL